MYRIIIALFTVAFSHLHYNVFELGCEAISGNFAVSARNCLTSMFKYIVMQMRNVNCEKGYCTELESCSNPGHYSWDANTSRSNHSLYNVDSKQCLELESFPSLSALPAGEGGGI